MTKYTFCENTISDLHKDAWGYRPSQGFWVRWEASNDDAKQGIWNDLIDDMVKNDAEDAKIKAENASKLAKRIKEACKLGASNYRTAIRWILEADGLEHDKYYGGDQLAWEFNIGFKHSKLFKLARVA